MNYVTINRFPVLGYAANEAVNTLCTNLSFAGENIKKIMITSCHASEGKSFMSMNIMRTLTQLGKTVVLVDADLRRSCIEKNYGLKFRQGNNQMGLAHLLTGKTTADHIVYETNIQGAYFVPIGREVSNSLALLTSPHFESLLDELAKLVDYVIVDAPPVGTIIDAAEIAKSCDGILLVVDYNAVRRQELIDVKVQLEQTGCPILGTVLNRVEFDNYLSRKYYYKSHYSSYYYGHADANKKKTGLFGKAKKKGART